MAGESSSSSSSSSPNNKRRRVDDDDDYAAAIMSSSCGGPPRKRHLYVALDDWEGGYSIHKLDADDILYQEPAAARGRKKHRLPEPAALRIASPVPGGSIPMAFVALGTNIFIDTNQLVRGERAAPTLVYDTRSGSLTGAGGPRVPDWIRDLSRAMAAGEKLYALTSPPMDARPSLQALSFEPIDFRDGERRYPWQPEMEWTWKALPAEMPLDAGTDVIAYALHPDGRTIFVSSSSSTSSLDTSTGAWKDLGDWALPFSGKAYYDADLDAWVGLHHSRYGHVCCCPVVSRSSAREHPPACQMLVDKLARRKEDPTTHSPLLRAGEKSSLTYMGESRYALFESILRGKDHDDGAVLHVTLFGLKYDHNGELRTKVLRSTRSYAVSKNTNRFSHAAFWL